MIPAALRPGYMQIAAASQLAANSELWAPFMRDVLGLPMEMLPAVQWAVNRNVWRAAGNPLASVKGMAERRAAREWKGCGDAK
jgi:hypothetical protein